MSHSDKHSLRMLNNQQPRNEHLLSDKQPKPPSLKEEVEKEEEEEEEEQDFSEIDHLLRKTK